MNCKNRYVPCGNPGCANEAMEAARKIRLEAALLRFEGAIAITEFCDDTGCPLIDALGPDREKTLRSIFNFHMFKKNRLRQVVRSFDKLRTQIG